MNQQEIIESFYEAGIIPGRLIAASKSRYREKFPDNQIFFNANLFVLGEGKVWHGDIDITRDGEIFQNISSKLGISLYVIREMDGRFENEELSDSDIIKKSVHTFNP